MTGLSLCSGVGGLDLGFEAAGGEVAAMCEIDKFCQYYLKNHWPDIPLYEDVRAIKKEVVLHESRTGAIDVIYGGFP